MSIFYVYLFTIKIIVNVVHSVSAHARKKNYTQKVYARHLHMKNSKQPNEKSAVQCMWCHVFTDRKSRRPYGLRLIKCL